MLRIMKFLNTTLTILSLISITYCNLVTLSSTKSLLRGPGRILETYFTPSGVPIFYNNLGEVLQATPTDYFGEYFEKHPPIPALADKDCQYSKNYRWDTNPAGKHQGKRIGHFISLLKVFLTLELEDFKPVVLETANLLNKIGYVSFSIYWVNSGDPTRVLVYAGYQLYYYEHNFDTNQYFQQNYFGNGPLGSNVYDQNAVTSAKPEDNGSDRFFVVTNLKLFSYKEDNKRREILLNGIVQTQANFNFALEFDKITNIIFVKGGYDLWLYSWNPSTETFSFLNSNPTMTAGIGGRMFFYQHPTENNKYIFLNALDTYIEIFHLNKITKEFTTTQRIISTGFNNINCHAQLLSPLIVGFSCEGSLFTASMLTGKHEQVYHIGIYNGLSFPINKNEVNVLIEGFEIVRYDINLGLMRPLLSVPYKWKLFDARPSNPAFMLFEKDDDMFEVDATNEIEETLLVSKFLLKLKRKTKNHEIFYIKYSFSENSLIYIDRLMGTNNIWKYTIFKHKFGETDPIELSDPFLNINWSYRVAITTFKYNNQNLVLWNSQRHVSIFEDHNDGVKIIPAWKRIASCPSGAKIMTTFAVNSFEGLFGLTCDNPLRIVFFAFDGTVAQSQTQLTVIGGYSERVVEFPFMTGDAFVSGSVLTRITKDENGDFQRIFYENKPGEEYTYKIGLPMINTLPGKVSIIRINEDRSIELFNENPDIEVNCTDKNCGYCRNGECLWCMPYYLKNFQGICQRICKRAGEYYIKETNSCASCHLSCKNCSGPGEKQCLKCYKGFLKEDGSCNEDGCEIKQKDGEPLITLEIQDKKENFKICKTCGNYCSTCSVNNDCITCKEGYYMNEEEGCSKGKCKEGFILSKKSYFCKRKIVPVEKNKLFIDSKSRNCFTEECKQCNVEGNFCFDKEIASQRSNYESGGAIAQIIAVSTDYVLQGMAVIFAIFSPETSTILIQSTQNLGLIRNLRLINVKFGELVDSFCRKRDNRGVKGGYKKNGGKFYLYNETAKPDFSLTLKIVMFISINFIFFVMVLFFLKNENVKKPKFCKALFVIKKLRFAINTSCLLDFSFKIPRAFIYMKTGNIYFGRLFLMSMMSLTSIMVYFSIRTLKYYKFEYKFFQNGENVKNVKNVIKKKLPKNNGIKEINEEKTLWLIKFSNVSVAKLVESYVKTYQGIKFSKYFPFIEKTRIIIFSCLISSLQQSSILNLVLLISTECIVLWYLLVVQVFFRSFKWVILVEKALFSILIIFVLLYIIFISYSNKISLGVQKRFIFMLTLPVLMQYIFMVIKGIMLAIEGRRAKKQKKEPFPSIIFKNNRPRTLNDYFDRK